MALPRLHDEQVKATTRGAAVAATPAQSASLTLPSARGHTATPDQLCIFVLALQSLKTAEDDAPVCSEPFAASSELQSVSSEPVSVDVSTLGVVVAPGVLDVTSEAYGVIAGLDSVQTSGTVVQASTGLPIPISRCCASTTASAVSATNADAPAIGKNRTSVRLSRGGGEILISVIGNHNRRCDVCAAC